MQSPWATLALSENCVVSRLKIQALTTLSRELRCYCSKLNTPGQPSLLAVGGNLDAHARNDRKH